MSDIAPYNASKITENLIVGGGLAGAAELDALVAYGVTHVVSAAAELDDRALALPRGLRCLHLAWADDGHSKPVADFLDAYAWLCHEEATAADAGRQVGLYVHCAAGVNRGPLLATFLLAARAGLGADTAWQLVSGGRPVAASFSQPAYRQSCVDALLALRALKPVALPEAAAGAVPIVVTVPAAPVVAEPAAAKDPAHDAPDAAGNAKRA